MSTPVVLRFTFDATEHTVTMDNNSADGPDQTTRWNEFYNFVWRVLDAATQSGRGLQDALPPWAPRPVVQGAPIYLLPGDGGKAKDAAGGIVTVSADNYVWRDGVKLGVGGVFARVKKLAVYGASILGQGFSDGLDWQWTGAGWVQVTLDHSVIVW